MTDTVPASRAKPPTEPAPPPAPLIAPTGSPGLNSVIDVVNVTAAPFQSAPPAEQGTAGAIAQGLSGVLGVVGAPAMLIDTAFATLTAPIAALFPALPAITLGGLHIGTPHAHTHPPSLVPPAPPVPLPSIGALMGSGSITVLLGGLPAARAGDIGIAATCGSLAPPFCVYTGSSNVFIGGARAARIGDITQHCNPQGGAAMGAFSIAMSAAAVAAGAAGAVAGGNPWAGAQAAADAAVLAIRLLCGKDPGVPPCVGALIGPPVPNVLIGGFPCPPIGEMAVGGILKGLKSVARAAKARASRRGNANCANGSHPIYLVTGENFDEFTDFVSGDLFEWRRHYTTARARVDSPLGHGFRHYYQRSLSLRLHRATFTDWDGVVIEFPRFERGTDITRSNGYVLRRLERGYYRLSFRDEPAMYFSGGEFDGELKLTRITRDRREILFAYDRIGRLTVAVETDNETTRSRRYELRYDEANHVTHLLEIPGSSPEAWTKPEPVVRAAYAYSPAAELAHAWDASGGAWTYEYDAFHRWVRQTDPRRYSFTFRYDALGRCVEAAGQDGLWWCKIDYYPDRRLTRYAEGDDAHWEYHYDTDGFVTKIVDPYGGVKVRERDGEGKLLREIDSGGRAVTWLYDEDGAHSARVNRFGHVFPPEEELPKPPSPFRRRLPDNSLAYLFAGVIEPAPGAVFGMDERVLQVVPPELATEARLTLRLRPAGAPGTPERDPSPRVVHDALGRPVQETDALGRTRAWHYDETGNVVASRDLDGRVSTQATTSWNLVGERRDALGNAMTFEYSRLEQVVGVTDPLGNVTRYEFDLKERLVAVYRHGRLREEYVYDGGDHLVEKRDGDGTTLFVNEPHENHLVGIRRLASGGVRRFDYDAQGRIIEASTETHEVRLGYDHGAHPAIDHRDGDGVLHRRYGDDGWLTELFGRFRIFRYRESGELKLVDPAGRSTSVLHDGTGSVRRYCDNGTVELLQFDEAGRLEARFTHRRDGFGRARSRSTCYTYTAEGDLIQAADSERGTTRYEVDEAHRLVAELTPRGERHGYFHDPAGNVTSKPGLLGLRVGAGNRVEATANETFECDARDRLVRRTADDGTTTRYEYDSLDMLVRATRTAPDGATALEWTASYDGLGRRIECGHAGDRREFFWDGDRLAAEVFPRGHLRLYHYASREALSPLGFTDYASRDADPASGRSYHVFSNPVGMPLCIEDDAGEVVWWANRIDPYGAVDLKPGATLEYNLRWPGHYHDPETGLHYNRYRYFDPALGRYLQSDPIGYEGSPTNLFAYPSNPLVHVDVLGLAHPKKSPKASDESSETDATEIPVYPQGPDGPPRRLSDMSDAELRAYCEMRARALNDAMAQSTNESTGKTHDASKGTTLSVGVVQQGSDRTTRRVVVTTSADDPQTLPPAAQKAMVDGETARVAPPSVVRSKPEKNPNFDENRPPNNRTNPERVSHPLIRDPDTGELKPYQKASNGEPVEGTQHHAEQRMVAGAAENGETVVAQAPTRPCCTGCQQRLPPEELAKIPTSLQGN